MALDPFLQSVYQEAWQLVQQAATINPDTGRSAYTAADVQAAAGELFARASGAEAFAYRSALGVLYGIASSNAYAAQRLAAADHPAGTARLHGQAGFHVRDRDRRDGRGVHHGHRDH